MNSSFLVQDENGNPVEDALQYISIMAYRNEFIFKNIDNAHFASQIITTIRIKNVKVLILIRKINFNLILMAYINLFA